MRGEQYTLVGLPKHTQIRFLVAATQTRFALKACCVWRDMLRLLENEASSNLSLSMLQSGILSPGWWRDRPCVQVRSNAADFPQIGLRTKLDGINRKFLGVNSIQKLVCNAIVDDQLNFPDKITASPYIRTTKQ